MRLSIFEGPVKPARYIWCGFTVHNDGFVAYIQFTWSSWGSIVNMQICDTILFYYLYDYTQIFSPVRICIQYFSSDNILALVLTYSNMNKNQYLFRQDLDKDCFCEFSQFCRAQKMAAMALRRFAPKILRTSTLPLTSSFSTSPSCLISSSLPSLAPIVQKPAPAFKAQAVVDGQFKEVCNWQQRLIS